VRAIFIDCPSFLADLYDETLQAIVPDLVMTIDDVPGGDVVGHIGSAVGVINDHTYMPAEILGACPALKVVVFMGTGASSYIDVEAAERLGIEVRTIKGYGDRSVAEHALALMFDCGRRTARMDRALRTAGSWQTLDSIEFAGKKLGVVGTGGIGREMVRLGAALDMEVLAWNRSGVPSDLPCTAVGTLDELLGAADVVSLHLGLNDETHGLIDARCLGLMKPNAIFINTARGAVVDEPALVEALRSGTIRAAGLDVFADEPIGADHPLIALENVTLTPHAGFMTAEASTRLLTRALGHMRDALGKLGA
jgi:D-3-phosphoglycerate dehydrogenase